MICDAHVHVGYFNCCKCGGVAYYSPRRIVGVLNRCGICEFVVSSTSAQADGVTVDGLLDEAREVARIAGRRAHQFLWVTWKLYEMKEWRALLASGLYEGIKLHEQEGHWLERHGSALTEVLDVSYERAMPVQFHAGFDVWCTPRRLMPLAEKYQDVRFDFAHCHPMDEMAEVMARCHNVWTDTAYMDFADFNELLDFGWGKRLMFGTDLPVWQAHEDVSLTQRYRKYVQAFARAGLMDDATNAFTSYVRG